MSASQMPRKERTDWRPASSVLATGLYEPRGWQPTPPWLDTLWPPVPPGVHDGFSRIGLLEKAWLDAFTNRVTTVPRALVVTHAGSAAAADPPEMPAQRMAAELRRLSGLTNEEIAPLLSVSRRSLQSWIAGEPISARKETRLRTLLDAIRQLAGDTAAATRERLLARAPRLVSAYDLLAEERYDAAIDLATGQRRHQLAPEPPSQSLAVQFDRIEDNFPSAPRLNRKLSGPLRR